MGRFAKIFEFTRKTSKKHRPCKKKAQKISQQNLDCKVLMYLTHEYLQYLREQQNCSLCYKKRDIEPHHVKYIGMGRDRKKPLAEHYSAIPVCRDCHTEYHNLGEKMYSIKHQVNPYEIAWYWLSKFLTRKEDNGIQT